MNKKIAKNYIYNLAYQIIAIISPIITAPYISRVLHSEGVGLVSYTNSITIVFTLFAALGFSAYGQREIAYYQDDLHKRSTLFFELALFRGIITLFVMVVFIIFSLIYTEYTVYLLPQIMIIFATVFDIAWYFHGMENFGIIVVRNLIIKVFTIASTFIFVRTPNDIGIYILIHSLSPLVSNFIYCFIIKSHIEKVHLKELHPIRHTKGVIEFFLPVIAVRIYTYLDKLMLGFYMETTVENGYYEQARKITSIVVTLIVSLNAVMMSRIANLYKKNDKEQIRQYYSKTIKIIIMLLFPVCFGLILISDNFVIWFFGEEFQPVSFLLKLCAILIPFMCIGDFVGTQFLAPTGLQNKMTKIYVIAAISNIIMNMILIPRFNSRGALYASILAEGISCLLQVMLLRRSEYKISFVEGVWKYLISVVIMSGMIILVHSTIHVAGIVATILDIVVGSVAYFSMLIVLREGNTMDIIKLISHKKLRV